MPTLKVIYPKSMDQNFESMKQDEAYVSTLKGHINSLDKEALGSRFYSSDTTMTDLMIIYAIIMQTNDPAKIQMWHDLKNERKSWGQIVLSRQFEEVEKGYNLALKENILELEKKGFSLEEIANFVIERRKGKIFDENKVKLLDSIVALTKSEVELKTAIQNIIADRAKRLIEQLQQTKEIPYISVWDDTKKSYKRVAADIPAWDVTTRERFKKATGEGLASLYKLYPNIFFKGRVPIKPAIEELEGDPQLIQIWNLLYNDPEGIINKANEFDRREIDSLVKSQELEKSPEFTKEILETHLSKVKQILFMQSPSKSNDDLQFRHFNNLAHKYKIYNATSDSKQQYEQVNNYLHRFVTDSGIIELNYDEIKELSAEYDRVEKKFHDLNIRLQEEQRQRQREVEAAKEIKKGELLAFAKNPTMERLHQYAQALIMSRHSNKYLDLMTAK